MLSQVIRVIEGFVVVVFLAVLGYGSLILSKLNQASASSWNLPTLTPTPLIQALILPGGKSPVVVPAEPQSGIGDIPSNLQPLVNPIISMQIPTPAPQQGIRIQIPALGIDAPIVQGDESEQLKKGVGQQIGTADLGQVGNMVLAGHNDTYGEVFRYLDQLKPGDLVIIFSSTRKYTYVVEEWTLVEPDQVDVMAPTNYERVTLISCYPYLVDNQRIIVVARLQKN
jgi:sortase A